MSASGLISPVSDGLELQQQIHQAKESARRDQVDIWWLGQSGFLIQWNGTCLLCDPYLSDSLTHKYANTQKPHVRMSEIVIRPELLDNIDIVTSSHNHTDHLDAETLIPVLSLNPEIKFIIPEANRAFVTDRVKCPVDFPLGLSDGEKTEVHGFVFHGVPAAHNSIERDEMGRCKFMGFVVRFGKWSFYHSGDTLWYENMVDVLSPFNIDLAFLPINGNISSRGVAGNLNGEEAASLGKAIGARLVIPHHYDLFEFNTADSLLFAAKAESLSQPYRILRLGEHFIFD